tara:strand:+ start:9204 stop:9704 length:501 start_codon:yes stop_codon:yes gene_type:complete
MKKTDVGFRGWFYLRQGWSNYLTFFMASVNTLTVTYFLAIERYPVLETIFPNFLIYVLITTSIGIPSLIIIGYVHWKRSGARKAEIDITYEVNPYNARTLVNSELLLSINFNLISMMTKLLNDEKLSKEEIEQIKKSQNEMSDFIKKRTFTNKLDSKFIKTESQEK